MPESLVARQYFNVTPPRAFLTAPGPAGEVVAIVTSVTAAVLDMTSFSQPVYNAQSANTQNTKGAMGSRVRIFAETTDLGIIFGPTLASVTGANVPSLAAAGTVNASGVYTNAVGNCVRIPAGTFYDCNPANGTDLFMGFVASGAGKMRLWQESPNNP